MNIRQKQRISSTFFAAALFAFIGLLSWSSGVYAQNVKFDNGVLSASFPRGNFEQLINQKLNQEVTGYKINSKSKTLYVKNFRASFDKRSIRILFDYDAKTRGWTKGPFGKIYGPWASDSGWIEVQIFLGVRDNQLYAYTRNGYVRWGSNNWFTNEFLGSALSQTVRDGVSQSVNEALANMLQGRSLNLKQWLIEHGAATVANNTGLSQNDARVAISSSLQSAQFNANVSQNGLGVSVDLAQPRAMVQLVNNSSASISFGIRFDPNDAWQNHTIAPNSTKHVWNTKSSNAQIKFDGSFLNGRQEKTYGLKPVWVRRIGKPLPQDGTRYTFSVNGSEIQLTK